MSRFICTIVLFSLLCTVNACFNDYDCSTNYWCPFDTHTTNGGCAPAKTTNAPCDPARSLSQECANGWCQPTAVNSTTGSCTALYPNGQACTDGQQCQSKYCDKSKSTCQVNPLVQAFADAAGGAALALTTIIIIAIAAPVGICVLICVCCYFCGRRQPVIVNNQQPKVMVASVPMQQQPQYYQPQAQPQWGVPQQQTQYQPLQYGGPQQQTGTKDGTTMV